LLVAVLLLALCSLPSLRAQTPELPAGPAQAKVTTSCLECHESRIITQQRLSKGAWTKEVDKMIKWGALVDPADRDSFIEYLSANFPPDGVGADAADGGGEQALAQDGSCPRRRSFCE
jgi:hypothetical protein